MKISNSKKQLAKIIHENGGWHDGAEWESQDKIGVEAVADEIAFYEEKPSYPSGSDMWNANQPSGTVMYSFPSGGLLKNWHQTILSREEYFHLHPAPVKVVVENKTTCHLTVADKPSVEQLAADYRNRKDYADRKQQEADAAKADAEAKLAELVAAGKALGLVLSVADAPEPELVITDWRDLQVGDIIEYVDGRNKNRVGLVGMVGRIDSFDRYNADTDRPVRMVSDNGQVGWPTKWRFIRRPSEDGANA